MMNLSLLSGEKSTKPENVRTAIKIMKRVKASGSRVNMAAWNDYYYRLPMGEQIQDFKEEQAHECGTACCLGGWLAISPEFQAEGGKPTGIGSPEINDLRGVDALGYFLGLNTNDANIIAYTGDFSAQFYGCIPLSVTPDMIIAGLETLL